MLVVFCLMNQAHAQIYLKNQFPNLTFSTPVGVYNAGDGTDRLFVVEQGGVIHVFPNDSSVSSTKIFLDLQDSIIAGNELGLLGLAFHPHYATNGYFYVDYTRDNPLRTVISRFQVNGTNPDSAVRTGEFVILQQDQPFDNHNGGQLAFGTDGYLYVSFGDGGSGGDPFENGQNKHTLLGKILRINIDSAANGNNYAIPADNPFIDSTGLKKEIFAYGLRNTWRFSIDQTGTLWAGDVGQGLWEEVDTVHNGQNFGWNIMEATHCFNPSSGCNQSGLTLPIHEYDHNGGRCAVTGGFVYRGSNIPSLYGKYIYGDFCSGQIWSLDPRPSGAVNTQLFSNSTNISSFGVDQNHELYICAHGEGVLYKFAVLAPGQAILDLPPNGQTNSPVNITFRWKSTTNATSYRLQVSTDTLFGTFTVNDSTITDTTKQIGPLASNTKYFWRVRAKNSGGPGPFSSVRKFTTINATGPPSAPALLSPANGALGQPTYLALRWNQSPGAESYHIQVARDSVFSSLVKDDSLIIDTTRLVGGLLTGAKYYWRVRGKNSFGIGGYSAAWSFTTDQTTGSYHMMKGWNLISLPLIVNNSRKDALFLMAASNAFDYTSASGYVARDTLLPGRGYWLKFTDSVTIIINGTPHPDDTINVETGWNMIGSNSAPMMIDSVTQLPPGIIVSNYFDYNGSYDFASAFEPAKGYWVKASGPGKIVLHSSGSMEPLNLTRKIRSIYNNYRR